MQENESEANEWNNGAHAVGNKLLLTTEVSQAKNGILYTLANTDTSTHNACVYTVYSKLAHISFNRRNVQLQYHTIQSTTV